MKKRTIKTILAALTAAAMVCSMAGCSGKDAGTAESSASGSSAAAENTGAAAENGKDSVIVVMGPSSSRRQDLIRLTAGELENMSMSR